MGYGSKALDLLKQYYEFKFLNVEETLEQSTGQIDNVPEDKVSLLEEYIEPRKALPPLLLKLSERTPEKLDYIGVSFGLTEGLLKFWYLLSSTNN